MIDIEFLKSQLYPQNEEERKIGCEDIITEEIVQLFRRGHVSAARRCFKRLITGEEKFQVLTPCSKCKKIIISNLSKAKLLIYLHGEKYKEVSNQIFCAECLKQEKEEEPIRAKQKLEEENRQREQRNEIIRKNTEKFISTFLDPNMAWVLGTPPRSKSDSIIHRGYVIDDNKVYEAIQKLKYNDFLNTLYWEGISLYTKYLSKFRCQLCASKDNLRTHHKTYDRHGYEHNLNVLKEDLIVLCDNCHQKFHDKQHIDVQTNFDRDLADYFDEHYAECLDEFLRGV